MISVLIPTINNRAYLQLAVEFFERYTKTPYEILIYDNGSDYKTAEYIAKLPHQSIRSEINRGVCKAYNELAKIAKGDYFLFWDDDKLALPDWDIHLIPLVQQEGQYGWKSLVEIWPYNTNPCSLQGNYGRTPSEFQEKILLEDLKLLSFPRKISLAVSQVMTRDLFEALHGYDEDFYPGFGSDPDIMWRAFCFLNKDTSKFLNANQSFYYHFTSSTTNRLYNKKLINYGLRIYGHSLFRLKHGFWAKEIYNRTGHGALV